ncbi:putative baseplate assembly protein [Aliikangiella marina]|uniref:Putative baseplate assembly protein n=1 Tax=Aliikangiella marina TaxID=1712262 RepID=A0A545T2U7_9GAMM|nr:baseplate J/gp47 family protein [Aliikangiella marina]TQV71505.1 putative baseplate assembly protein [Aliikangiella marina]
MPLPIPNLDDRRFKDLVEDAKARLMTHVPELTQIAPGDPAHAFVDLFAYLTESILFRANLIPERQRRVVLNLLQIPLRNAVASRGVVCIDSGARRASLPSFIPDGAQLKAKNIQFTGIGELQPTPLVLNVSIKTKVADETLTEMGVTQQALRDQYGLKNSDKPLAFEPKSFELGNETLALTNSIDSRFYLALTVPKTLRVARDTVRENLAGELINIAIAPADDLLAEEIDSMSDRELVWELLSQDEEGNLLNLPLDVVYDSSRGGRQIGVVRLRLPDNADLFDDLAATDPMFAGLGNAPPELPANIGEGLVALWIRLSCPDEPDLSLGYLGINGLEVKGCGQKNNVVIGVGSGNPDQVVNLPDQRIDKESLVLQVEEDNAWVTWQQVDVLVGLGGEAKVYRLDANQGVVYFGDGLEGGKRPAKGKRIRIGTYLYGGGVETNLPIDSIKEISNGSQLTVRHEWPCKGGIDAESVEQAEKRIPEYLTHRNRAVTKEDFQLLCMSNPVTPVALAEVIEGFVPGATIQAARQNVPGAVSVFVLPPKYPALRQTPKATRGLLINIYEYLSQRTLVGTELYVLSPEFVPMATGVMIDVLESSREQEIKQAVQNALVQYLWPVSPGGVNSQGWGMGVTVAANELMTVVSRVDGVRAVNGFSLFINSEDSWTRLPEDGEIILQLYQLPELLGVSVGIGDGEPAFPSGIEPETDSSRLIPAPVIPEVC